MNVQPLVTVAIPAFNIEFFRATLVSALAQDYANLEIVVCDDSGDGQIESLCKELANATAVLRYIRNPVRRGFARNMLACLEHARGEMIKFLCDDDTLFPNCVGLQAQALQANDQVSMVIGQRLLISANDVLLPSRLLNFVISMNDAVLHGNDLLHCVADNATNLFGGFSHALFRRAQVQEYLATLVQEGQGFAARLDLALYACLLRRGHLCSLSQVLSLERVHPGRLSHQTSMTEAAKRETDWLLQMFQGSTGEAAPAYGWVRYCLLEEYREDRPLVWDEFDLRLIFSGQMANFQQQVGVHSLSFDDLYAQWLESRKFSAGQLQLLPKRIGRWARQPRIVAVIESRLGQEAALRVTLASLHNQSYPAAFTLVIGPDLPASNTLENVRHLRLRDDMATTLNRWLAENPQADWVLLLEAGDRLHEHALVLLAERMVLRTECLCIYSDEGANDNLKSSTPVFKPDFNLDLMRSVPYVGRMLALNVDQLRTLGGLNPQLGRFAPHDMLWRMVETQGLHVVEHIAEVLVQSLRTYSDWLQDPADAALATEVVRNHLQRLGVPALVEQQGASPMTRVTYVHPQPAMVSILVYAGSDLMTLERCIESLMGRTAYPHFEVLLVGDEGCPPHVCAWLQAMAQLGVEQVRFIEVAALGQARSLDMASQHARGEYLLMLDVGCVLFDSSWLHELMLQAQRPEVGLVGPKLFDDNGAVVSAGLVLGLYGSVGSPFLGCPMHADGYMGRLQMVQNWSALSLHCLVVRRDLFTELGGLDADQLGEGLLEADLCLRARSQGYLVVWTPFSRVARPQGIAAGAAGKVGMDVFYDRWLSVLASDQAYNRNLSLKYPNFNFEPGLRSSWDPFIARVMPTVLALPSNTTAIGHYRVVQPFTELERAGWIQGRINYNVSGVIELEQEKPDALILQCRYTPAGTQEIAQFKRYSNARRIYEIDDYIIDPPKKNDHARKMPDNMRELVAKAIGLCDRVVVSTEPLADALSSMHQDIRIVPNMLAASLWKGLLSQRQTTARPRVGWAGGTSHRGDLELIIDVVKTLSREVDWVFFGMCPEELLPYVKEFHEGISFSLYPQKLAGLNLDLALAPLEQNLFNDCKSNLRLLEYGACGFPVICTDTKAYAGYLPCTRVRQNTSAQWLEAIRMHLDDSVASYAMGDALRESVLRDYVLDEHHLQHWANAWLAD
ncbi:glycosyltransferase [Pseudomonas sp. SWRI107]|nr:glycosyltransferase [Pseudomonas farsensis]